jgi:hypothetical protein
MAIVITPKFKDIESTDAVAIGEDSALIHYVAITTEDEDEPAVRAQAVADIPLVYSGLILTKVFIRRESDDVWEIDVSYESDDSESTLPKLEVDQVRWSVRSGSSGTLKRTFSLELIEEVVAAGFDDYQFDGTAAERVIGLTSTADGLEVEGIDVPQGRVEITVQTVKSALQVNAGYLVDLANYASDHAFSAVAWRGFPAGTIQLVDYSADQRGGDNPDWDIGMSLVYSPNLTNIDIGNGITIASKKGHEILDVLYARKTIQSLPLSIPIRAAVHRANPLINLNAALGI